MIARSAKVKLCVPVVETIQKNNICHYVIAPALIPEKIKKTATRLAIKTMKYLKARGVRDWNVFNQRRKVLLNEIAPRVHNSGHYTIEACYTSQFEQHIRQLPVAFRQNRYEGSGGGHGEYLGDRLGAAEINGLDKVLKIPGISVHIYGKAKPNRNGKWDT